MNISGENVALDLKIYSRGTMTVNPLNSTGEDVKLTSFSPSKRRRGPQDLLPWKTCPQTPWISDENVAVIVEITWNRQQSVNETNIIHWKRTRPCTASFLPANTVKITWNRHQNYLLHELYDAVRVYFEPSIQLLKVRENLDHLKVNKETEIKGREILDYTNFSSWANK